MKIGLVGGKLFLVDRRTDEQTDRQTDRQEAANSRFSQFCVQPPQKKRTLTKIRLFKTPKRHVGKVPFLWKIYPSTF